jgi:hypothetical protein
VDDIRDPVEPAAAGGHVCRRQRQTREPQVVVLPIGALGRAIWRTPPLEQRGRRNQVQNYAVGQSSLAQPSGRDAGPSRQVSEPIDARQFGNDFIIGWHQDPDIDAALPQG